MDKKNTISSDNIPLTCDESISNKSNTDDDCEDSCSSIDALSGDMDEERLLEKEIEEKRKVLKWRRQELSHRLMQYKLMQFSTSQDVYSIPTREAPQQTEFKVPPPVVKPADSTTHSSSESSSSDDSSPEPVAAFFNEHAISYGFSEESMLEMAIKASLEDFAKTQAAANQPPPEAGPSTSGFSDEAETEPEPENQNYPEAVQNPLSIVIPGSSGSSKPFVAVNPLRGWNTSQPDAETQNQHRESGTEIEEIVSEREDFMEGERYVGDKGKRPLSGKYSYKKRSKASQADSDEQPSGS